MTEAVLVDRHALGAAIVKFILDADSRVVVLHGKPASGKTELIRRWVIPGLTNAGNRVWYGACEEGLPAELTGPNGPVPFDDELTTPGIVVVDNFENLVVLARDDRRAALDRILQHLRTHTASRFVVVTNTNQLTSAYALASEDRNAASAVFEIPPIGIADGLELLCAADPDGAPKYTMEVLDFLREEAAGLEQQGWPVNLQLITLLDRRFRAWPAASRLDRDSLEKIDGIAGILRTHLEDGLQQLVRMVPDSEEIGRAILERLADAHARGTAADFDDLAPRLGVSEDQVEQVRARLVSDVGLMRRAGQTYEPVPPQLGMVLLEDFKNRIAEAERPRRIIDEGLRSWRVLGSLLLRPRFEDVHLARTSLDLNQDQVRFLLHCALRHEAPHTHAASAYWLRRLHDRVDAMDILLASLFDASPDARWRAAFLLRDFDEPKVRERLYVLAVTDPDPDSAVRAEAIASLAALPPDQTLLMQVIEQARDPGSPHRTEAIEALRIIREPQAASVLTALVSEPKTSLEHRSTAIRVLSNLDTHDAVDALLDIAMHDADEPDRAAAAESLGTIKSPELNRHLAERLRTTDVNRHLTATRVVATLAASGLGVGIFVWMLVFSMRGAGAVLNPWFLVSIVMLMLQLPIGAILLRRLGHRRLARSSPLGILAVALFGVSAVSALFWFHGLGYFSTGRWRRGLALIAVELLGIGMMLAAPWFAQPWKAFSWFYLAAGFVLFIASYALDVTGVLFDSALLLDATEQERRRHAVYERVIASPVFTALLFELLSTSDTSAIRWARRVLGEFGRHAEPRHLITVLRETDRPGTPLAVQALKIRKSEQTIRSLEQLWPDADAPLKSRIAHVLAARPTQGSVGALARLWDRMGLTQRCRAILARWSFRVAIWPRPIRVGFLLALPAAVVFVVNGFMSRANPAWPFIMTLRQSVFLTPEEVSRNASTVDFLAATWPKQSGPSLFRLYQQSDDPNLDHAHAFNAALARGLVKVQKVSDSDDATRIHGALMEAAPRYGALLKARDSATFLEALGVLRAMADADDSIIQNSALMQLVTFAGDSSASVPYREHVIDSIAAVRFERSLIALAKTRSQLEKNSEWGLFYRTEARMNAVTTITYAPIRNAEGARDEVDTLLTILERLNADSLSTDQMDTVRIAIELQLNRCNRSGAECEVESALARIAAKPRDEAGFRRLLSLYGSDYDRAAERFTQLKQKYPRSLWPRKIIAELNHEYLADKDSSSFERSYAEMRDLRRLRQYAQWGPDSANFYRFEADFAEIALSAGRYGELETAARAVLTSDAPVYQMNMRLFLYMAAVMQHEPDSAEIRLQELETAFQALPDTFYNGWLYPGTRLFIERSDLPEDIKRSLQALCRQEDWWERDQALRIIGDNRSALRQLGTVTSLEPH